jgi:hypothetical protein
MSDSASDIKENLPVEIPLAKLPTNRLRVGHGTQLNKGKIYHKYTASTGAGLRSINDVSLVKIGIASGNKNAMLNPSESLLMARVYIKTKSSVDVDVDHDKEKYFWHGASSLIRCLRVTHLTKGSLFERVDNYDQLCALSKSLLPKSFYENSLCYDVDGSALHSYVIDTKDNLDAAGSFANGNFYKGVFDANKYLADNTIAWAATSPAALLTAPRKFYNPSEVNRTIQRTMNREVTVEIPLISGLLSSSNKNLVPLYYCPLQIEMDLNNIATALKMTVADAVEDIQVEFYYYGCIYEVSDSVAEEVGVMANSGGIYMDYDRIECINSRIMAGTTSYSNTMNFQQVSSVQSIVAALTPDAALSAWNRERYYFCDGSSQGQTSANMSHVSSLQYQIGTLQFPQALLQVKPYNFTLLHTLAKSAILSDGSNIVYQTDSNSVANFCGEDHNQVYQPGLADKFQLSMAVSNLDKNSYRSGLSLVNSPLSVDINFNNGLTENHVLNLWLVHQAEAKITTTEISVKR